MEFLLQYKDLLGKSLQSDLESAGKLIKGFHESGVKPDSEAFYLEAAYYYYTCQYGLALYYADMSYLNDPDFEPVHQLINYITDYAGDFKNYEPTFKRDVSSYNKKLIILMYKGFLPIVDYTVEACQKVFEKLGHQVQIVNIKKDNDKEGLTELVKCMHDADVDFVFTFNNIGMSITFKDEYYFDLKNIKVFNYLFDHPMAFYDSLDNPPKNMILTCVDKKHVDYVKRFYKNVNNCFFFPLGSEESLESTAVTWKERTIQALYVGSLKVVEKGMSDEFSDYVYDYLIKSPNMTTEYAIEKCFKECSEEIGIKIFGSELYNNRENISDEKLKLIIQKYRFVDLNVNSYYRKKLVQILVENGVDVDVYGAGWQYPELLNNKYFHYKGMVPQTECLKQMKNTRFVLNSMPWFKDGVHDRVYNAMLAGAVCVTDVSKFMEEEFTDGEDIVYYHLEEMEKLPEIIKYYEAHPDEAEKIAGAGYAKVAVGHTWQTRVIELLNRYTSGDYK